MEIKASFQRFIVNVDGVTDVLVDQRGPVGEQKVIIKYFQVFLLSFKTNSDTFFNMKIDRTRKFIF